MIRFSYLLVTFGLAAVMTTLVQSGVDIQAANIQLKCQLKSPVY